MAEFTFRTNSKIKTLVGQELITNNNVAIFELIKNSYDAGATEVEIQFNNFEQNDKGLKSTKNSTIKIIDNGVGMTTTEIDKYWMELGNSSKENNKVIRNNSDQMGKVIKRFANGEKGIGRFGVDKIGSFLTLESIGKNSNHKTTVFFDWSKYDDRTKLLQEIKNEYIVESIKDRESSGLTLTIGNLREEWKEGSIEKLKKDIRKFLSPNFIENSDFRIFISYDSSTNKEELKNETFNYLTCKLISSVDINGDCSIAIYSNGEKKEENTFKLFVNGSPIGKVKAEIYYLDKGDKNRFTRNMGITATDYGNVKVFRDNFRIIPYGEPHNDWLEIDRNHAQGFFRTFGTRDIIGNINLDGKSLSELDVLKEATDRVGFIEDAKEFEILKEYVWKLIRTLEDYVFSKIKKETKENTEIVKKESNALKNEISQSIVSMDTIINRLEIPQEDKINLKNDFSNASKQLFKRVEKIEDATEEIEKKIKIYSQLSNKEGILFEMLHSIKNKLVVINNEIDYNSQLIEMFNYDLDLKLIKSQYLEIEKLVIGSLNKINSSKLKRKNIQISALFNELLPNYQVTLEAENINFSIKYRNNVENENLFCSFEVIKNIFDNLFNNSIKALKGITSKKIQIEVDNNNNKIQIFFSDNGCGIPEDKINTIFTLWSSNTGGTGIGLASVKDNIEDMDGEINVVDLYNEKLSTTLLMSFPRRK